MVFCPQISLLWKIPLKQQNPKSLALKEFDTILLFICTTSARQEMVFWVDYLSGLCGVCANVLTLINCLEILQWIFRTRTASMARGFSWPLSHYKGKEAQVDQLQVSLVGFGLHCVLRTVVSGNVLFMEHPHTRCAPVVCISSACITQQNKEPGSHEAGRGVVLNLFLFHLSELWCCPNKHIRSQLQLPEPPLGIPS